MKRIFEITLLFMAGLHGLLAEERGKINRLGEEKSPYLLLHADNPVDWYPWGEEAFAKAREEEKPILLSVGYSTCHWCHVMERESFRDAKVAEFLNEHFVSIKLDREERPDVDAVYMKKFQALTGQGGGWPLNVFLTPELKLFFGGTYFPPDSADGRPSFDDVLEGVERAWREERASVVTASEQLTEHLSSFFEGSGGEEGEPAQETVAQVLSTLSARVDEENGGWGEVHKFPQASHLLFLLRSEEAKTREQALFTCRKMAQGGIHDHLGGGFHRYAVDKKWLVPHFEKMLYDQAQLLEVYCEAWRLTQEPLFRETATGIADYVLSEMRDSNGAFYSAQDAQSEGKEGKYWCWTLSELKELLDEPQLAVVQRVFGVTEEGNFYDFSDPEALTKQNVLSIVAEPGDEEERYQEARALMTRHRAQRVPPATDDKILAGWNGLMIAALAEASLTLQEPRYLAAARKAFQTVAELLWDGQRLANRWREDHVEESQQALNYLAMAKAGRQLYEVTLEGDFLEQGLRYLDTGCARFFDSEQGGFYDGEAREDLVLRLKEDFDNALPTASSLAAQELVWYAEMTDRADLRAKLLQTLTYFGQALREEPFALPALTQALAWHLEKPARLVVVGEGQLREEFLRLVATAPGGDLVVMSPDGPVSDFTKSLASDEGVRAYLCKGNTCREPTTEPKKILQWLLEKPTAEEDNE